MAYSRIVCALSVDVLVGEDELHQAVEGSAHAYLVSGVEVAVQPEEPVKVVSVVPPTHLSVELAQAVGDKRAQSKS